LYYATYEQLTSITCTNLLIILTGEAKIKNTGHGVKYYSQKDKKNEDKDQLKLRNLIICFSSAESADL